MLSIKSSPALICDLTVWNFSETEQEAKQRNRLTFLHDVLHVGSSDVLHLATDVTALRFYAHGLQTFLSTGSYAPDLDDLRTVRTYVPENFEAKK